MLYFIECLRIQVQTCVSSLRSHPGAVDLLCLWDFNHLKDGLINYDPKSFVSCLNEPYSWHPKKREMMAVEMASSIKGLSCDHEDLSSIPSTHVKTGREEVEAGDKLSV